MRTNPASFGKEFLVNVLLIDDHKNGKQQSGVRQLIKKRDGSGMPVIPSTGFFAYKNCQADRQLGRLDMYSEYIPNIDLFMSMHVLKEATQSSKIEGTKTNIEDVLQSKSDIAEEKPTFHILTVFP